MINKNSKYIPFTKKLNYLGTNIDFILEDSIDVKSWIKVVNKVIITMNKKIILEIK